MNARPARLAYLDGLRGIAALIVAVFFHYVHFSGTYQPGGEPIEAAPLYGNAVLHALYAHGDACVNLFFLLSGCVFTHVYGQAVQAGRVGFWAFFARRVARLYPAHLATLALTAGLIFCFRAQAGRFPVYQENGWLEFLLNLGFVQFGSFERGQSFNGPAWSLSVEAYAYGAFFLLARAGLRPLALGGAIAASAAVMFWAPQTDWRPHFWTARLGVGFAGFLLGCCIARFGPRAPVRVTALACALGAVAGMRGYGLDAGLIWVLGCEGLLALQAWPALAWPLERRPLLVLGDLSLAVYLVHFPLQVAILLLCHQLGQSVPLHAPWFLVLYAGLVLGSAWLLHFGLERPAGAWLRRVLRAGRAG